MRSAAHSRDRTAFKVLELVIVSAFILTGVLAVVNVTLWFMHT